MSERNLYLRGDKWCVRFRLSDATYRRSLGTTDIAEARRIRDGMRAAITGRGKAAFVTAERGKLLTYLIRGRDRALKRDRARGRIPVLSMDDVRTLLERSGGKCEATGIPFSLQAASNTRRRPYAPSLDRLDNSRPYSLANCRLVCVAVNIAINEWGEEIFRDIALGFLSSADTRVTVDGHSTKEIALSA